MSSLCNTTLCSGIVCLSALLSPNSGRGECQRCTSFPTQEEENVNVVHISHQPRERRGSPLCTSFIHTGRRSTPLCTSLPHPGRILFSPLYTLPTQGGDCSHRCTHLSHPGRRLFSPLYTLFTHPGRRLLTLCTSSPEGSTILTLTLPPSLPEGVYPGISPIYASLRVYPGVYLPLYASLKVKERSLGLLPSLPEGERERFKPLS